MAGFTPLAFADWRTLLQTQFQSSLVQAGYALADIPSTGEGTIMGAVFDGFALMALAQQNQDLQVQQTSRLATIPENADGSPNPEVDTFVAPFGYTRVGGNNATYSGFVLNPYSPRSVAFPVPVGLLFTAQGNTWQILPDTTQAAYDPTLFGGVGGYTVPAGGTAQASGVCLTSGSVGNVPAGTSWAVYGGPGTPQAPGLGSITNPTNITSGVDAETDAELKARFTLGQQNSRWSTITAIKAAILGAQVGLTYSLGELMNADGSYHASYMTIVVNNAGSSGTPTQATLDAVSAAVESVRGATSEFQVIAPIPIAPAFAGNIAVRAGSNVAQTLLAAQTAVQTYANNIGLDPDGNPTTFSYAQALANIIASSGVNPIGTTFTINGIAGQDVVAPFASQIVCPTLPVFTVSS